MMTPPERPRLVVGIGAMRCGTTSLHRFFAQHPEVRPTRSKEVHFFDQHHSEGVDWYRAQFEPGAAPWRADVTPSYMFDPEACARIADHAAAVVAILRDPVTRAYSHYLQKRSRGSEQLSFSEALDAEPERLQQSGAMRRNHSYVARGHYLPQLRPYEDAVGRAALHVMLLDDLHATPAETWRALTTFLGIDAAVEPPAEVTNGYVEHRSLAVRRASRRLPEPARRVVGRLNARRRPPPPLHDEDRDRLRAVFGPGVDELSAWLGRDLRALWWA
jgi:hypothetical protein